MIAAKGIVDKREIARLKDIKSEGGARQEDRAAQREDGKLAWHVACLVIAVGHSQTVSPLRE